MSASNALLERLGGVAEARLSGPRQALSPADEVRQIKASGLFDETWYREKTADLPQADIDPVEHYVLFGDRIGLAPHPLFDVAYYRKQFPDVADITLLTHFLRVGRRSFVSPQPLFDAPWYARQNPSAALRNGVAAFHHFISRGGPEGRSPHLLFDAAFYLANCEGLHEARVNPLTHFVGVGAADGFDPHPLFKLDWYARRNNLNQDANALIHYLEEGAARGCDPHPLFRASWYARQAGGATAASANALVDYLSGGAAARRSPHPLFDAAWYAARNGVDAGRDALEHFLTVGAAAGLDPHPLFSIAWWRTVSAAAAARHPNPLIDYLLAEDPGDPHPCFDLAWYQAVYMRGDQSGWDPLSHYLVEGAARGAYPSPYLDPAWYRSHNRVAPDVEPLSHYLATLQGASAQPARCFDAAWYAAHEPDAMLHVGGPFGHFVSARKTRDVAGHPLTSQTWPRTFDAPDVYNSGAETRLNYLASIGATLQASLAADAAKACAPVYEQLLGVLLQSAKSWPISSTASNEAPTVSVIIPVYNGLHLTLACLESIARCPSRVSFEVIVADNQSDDQTRQQLSERDDIRYILNPENVGFLRSCNRAASMARGKYVFLLNNDTMVCPGWLDELVATFDEFDEVGLVGSRLLFPDGSLQEAGGIIWRDGSAWNFGRHQDPGKPEFSYLRSVDYVSGCAIMVPKTLWDDLGGFDELFAPSYCEDSDLALRIRAAGLKVLYQPMSTIIHFEGMTQGRDDTQGVKAYQVSNTVKLRQRWQDYFATLQENGEQVDVAKDRNVGRRALFIDNCTPACDEDAGSITAMNLMLMLRDAGFVVSFIPHDNFLYLPKYTKPMQARGIEVIYGHFCNSVEQHLSEHGARYDVVVLFRPQSWERSIGAVKAHAPQAKILYHTCDLHFVRMEREARLSGDVEMFAAAQRMERLEMQALEQSDGSIVHSTAELQLVRHLLPGAKADVFSWAIPIEGSETPFEQRRDLVFIGGYNHAPNVDAVIYFVGQILPLVRERLPDVTFRIVGSKPPPEVLALEGPGVEVVGFVEDLKPVLDGARLAVAPLRYGGGIKGKVATTLAAGLPTVTTRVGAEGMELADGETILIEDEPTAFAEAVVAAYTQPELWGRLAAASLAFAERAFGPTSAWRTFIAILDRLDLAPPGEVADPRLVRPTHNSTCKARRPAPLRPLEVCRSLESFAEFRRSARAAAIELYDRKLFEPRGHSGRRSVPGYCAPIDRFAVFELQAPSGGRADLAELREALTCPVTGMNNRERLLTTLAMQALEPHGDEPRPAVLLLEESAERMGLWLRSHSADWDVLTPPLYGPRYAAGEIDLIFGNDFLEHAPAPNQTLAECARLLRPGGVMLTTTALSPAARHSVSRARIAERRIEHLAPPVYYGDRTSSLVFTDFGWDLLEDAKRAGFADASVEVYHAPEFANVGGGLLVCRFDR